ncbi:hypothetical protein K505DRAFT_340489 [Melanomma pulvis-pyrius CBS 109.77]|uniref:BTB domain-containing protein n=1 Tax=Melanomma pulvis-pyrius CBS 109.77 TaxID=1314802 RepID=A0A6A6X208_9PLEO|nr:hypothetical protein K505DRAFT_340489 [Melanomma pulvis-pyrius CBS 109.77]
MSSASQAKATRALIESMAGFLQDGKHSDFTIICGDDIYKVHKIVIASLSQHFRRAIEFGKEKEENSITLHDDDHDLVKLMIQFMYTIDYDVTTISSASAAGAASAALAIRVAREADLGHLLDPNHCEYFCLHGFRRQGDSECPQLLNTASAQDLVTHAELYSLADKYMMQSLKDLCIEKFKMCCHHYYYYSEALSDAIEAVYENTPGTDLGLRDVVVELLCQKPELLNKDVIKETLKQYNELTIAVLMQKGKELTWW